MSLSLSTVDGPGDAELIAAVRGGDVDAYGELFARHVEAARRLARQLAGPGDADDLVSDAFAKVLTVLQRGGGPDLAFRAYLLTAVRRLHVDRIRSGSRLRPVDDLAPFDPGVPFHDTAIEGFDNATAAKAFASLPERWQMVLWHTEVEQQKPADIALLLGMSANSVSALAYRAREGLRQAFLSMHAADPDDVDCAWTRDHLGAYVRGGLSRRDAARVDDHIADCRACAAVYLELTEVNSGLAALLAPLLLGAAGVGYLSSTGGGAAVGAAGATGFAAAKGWVATHASLSAVGGVALTATAVVAVYAASHLGGHGASPQGSPPELDRAASSSSHATVSPQGGHDGRTNSDTGKGTPSDRAGDPSASTTTAPTGDPTSATTTSGDSAPPSDGPSTDPASGPSDGPSSDPTSGPTDGPSTDPASGPSDPTSGPTDPTSGPTDPTSGPTDPGGSPITFSSTPPADPRIGGTYEVRATGGSGTPLTFSVDAATTNAACSIAGSTVSFDHAGTCVIDARESGSTAGRAATRAATIATQSVVVPQTPQSVSFDSTVPADAAVDGSYQVAATSTSGRPVTLTLDPSTTNDSCAVTGSVVSFHHVGRCVISAVQSGDADLATAEARQAVTVDQGTQVIKLVPVAPSAAHVGDSYTYTATGGASGNDVKVTTTDGDVCSAVGTTISFLNPGQCEIHADQAGNADYAPAPTVTASVKVTTSVDVDLAVTAVKRANIGGLSGVTATVTGLPTGATATLTVSADGNEAFRPEGATADICTSQTSTLYTCAVKPGQTSFTFAVNTERGRDVTFQVQPDPPQTDTHQADNRFGVHWDA